MITAEIVGGVLQVAGIAAISWVLFYTAYRIWKWVNGVVKDARLARWLADDRDHYASFPKTMLGYRLKEMGDNIDAFKKKLAHPTTKGRKK